MPEPESGATTEVAEAEATDIQIPNWNLGERIPIVPQIWDADTPQVGVGAAGSDAEVDIITLDDKEIAPAAPELPKKSPKEKRKKKRKRSTTQESEGRLVIRLKTTGSASTAEAVEEEGRLSSTVEFW
jgi:hypothetical protein